MLCSSMYVAIVECRFGDEYRFGPTTARDEASRLARAWLEHAPKPAGLETVGVRIERTEMQED